jgi:hypothetical protein
MADRAEQRPLHGTVTSVAHDEQPGSFRAFQQSVGRPVVDDLEVHRHAGITIPP